MSVYCFILFLGLVLLASVIAYVRTLRRKRRLPEVMRCRCGYELDQLDTVRCPECGRVSGFDATAEELELTDEQLRLAKAKRDARMAEAARLAETTA